MEVRRCGLVLLLVLSTVLLSEAQPKHVAPRYKTFLNQHVHGDMAEAWCTREIKKRKITDDDGNKCKRVNTFIRATDDQVKAVCQKGGKSLGGNVFESNNQFSVVTCTLQSAQTDPHCVYKGKKSNQFIRIKCEQGWPVHYDEDIIGIIMSRYKKFLNQHVHSDMAEAWCQSEIKKREITDGDSNNCKPVNTFIRATKNQVKAVCEKDGRSVEGNLFESNNKFSVVTCTLQSGQTVPHCEYSKGEKSNRFIRIGCEQGWPVHYDEGIIG